MRKQIGVLIASLVALTTSNTLLAQHSHHAHEIEQEEQEETQKYTCPMHPEVITDHPGNCPKCGMKLVPLAEHKRPTSNVQRSTPNHQSHMSHPSHEMHPPSHAGREMQ